MFYSALPWITFTSIDHTINLRHDDATQRVSRGRYFQADDKTMLPFNIQVSHLFVDGVHLGMFKERLDTLLILPAE